MMLAENRCHTGSTLITIFNDSLRVLRMAMFPVSAFPIAGLNSLYVHPVQACFKPNSYAGLVFFCRKALLQGELKGTVFLVVG